jgi:phosphoribosylaminoimidazolecarboxamide formyltransferase/IMP cyclohydrolase
MAVNVVRKIDDCVPVRNVLLSVSDKTGLSTFVPGLLQVNPRMRFYSTGGTYSAIRDMLGPERASANLVSVSDYTGQPEMQGGLVKTLDFKIYLGLLSETYNDAHRADLARVGGVDFDMVVVNLYPFRETVGRAGATAEDARSNIDIGGPCMVRASAKNYLRVASVTDPADYPGILVALADGRGTLSLEARWDLARKAFRHTAQYDAAIASYLEGRAFKDVRGCYEAEGSR